MIAFVAFGFIVAPAVTALLERGQLYGTALIAAGWWPIFLLWWFHPQRRPTSLRFENWFHALLLDGLALCVVVVLFLAVSKNELPSF